jgi:hypothetical protein
MKKYLKAVAISVFSTLVLKFLTLGMTIPAFLPAFVVSIAAIVLLGIDDSREALIVSLTSYLFSSVIISTYLYGVLFYMGLNSITFQFGLIDLVDNLLTPIAAIIAAMIGSFFIART